MVATELKNSSGIGGQPTPVDVAVDWANFSAGDRTTSRAITHAVNPVIQNQGAAGMVAYPIAPPPPTTSATARQTELGTATVESTDEFRTIHEMAMFEGKRAEQFARGQDTSLEMIVKARELAMNHVTSFGQSSSAEEFEAARTAADPEQRPQEAAEVSPIEAQAIGQEVADEAWAIEPAETEPTGERLAIEVESGKKLAWEHFHEAAFAQRGEEEIPLISPESTGLTFSLNEVRAALAADPQLDPDFASLARAA